MILYLIIVVTIAMVIEILILNSLNAINSNKTSIVLLNQVVSIIEDNEENETQLIETLKEDYIIRAQTVSYILDSKPEAEYDVEELKKIAGMMHIDEIHLFDETGKIYSGTEPKYYGYSFDSGEQMAYFKDMLEDKSLTMCQDVTPNTAEGKSMMYAITWNDSGDKMIQVGIEPLRLLEELRGNEVSEVIANMPAYEGINILVADADSGVIYGSTNESLIDKTLDETGILKNASCNSKKTGDYLVVVAYSAKENFKNIFVALAIELVYLLAAGTTIIYMIKRLLRVNDEKNVQMEILASMSDIYNSMHLIDLENNTVMQYSARDEISKVVKQTSTADEMMKQTLIMSTEDEYLEAALAFTDISTIADRMKRKKIISEEFVSKAIGWYRASFITIEINQEGRPSKLIYVTQNIDKEKKKEEELIFKSNADQLTGLYNRRAYEDDIAEHHDTVTEDNFVFVSLDVNGLKNVNDTMGHIAGDELLVGAADCMKQCFGSYGKIYRNGGDEFAAILFANEEQLKEIKKDFDAVTAKWSGHLVHGLSVSCGYVTKNEVDISSVHEIANLADKRMYEAKSAFYKKGAVRQKEQNENDK
jgi:diguanylate cyclase (GGDEF)-like protein